jgi:hypothetical protein
MASEGMGDALMAGCFVGPAATIGVGPEGFDVGERVAEFGCGDIVVAGLEGRIVPIASW